MKYRSQSRRIDKLEQEYRTRLTRWEFKGVKVVEPSESQEDEGFVYLVIKKFSESNYGK